MYVVMFTNEDYESEDRIFKYMKDLWKETTNEKRIVKKKNQQKELISCIKLE